MNYELSKTNPIKPNFSNGRAGSCYMLVSFDVLLDVLWNASEGVWMFSDALRCALMRAGDSGVSSTNGRCTLKPHHDLNPLAILFCWL
jgi:hypothetical protein